MRSFFAYANSEAAVTFVSESIMDPVLQGLGKELKWMHVEASHFQI